MAQGIKKFVAREMKYGNSVKSILSEVVKNKECNWYDTVRAFLWWLWFKCEPVVLSLLDFLKNIFAILFWIVVLLIIGTVVSLIITVVVVLTSPFWMPFRLWFAPEKVACLLLDTTYEDFNKTEEAPIKIWENIWLTGGKTMNFFWRWAYNLLPMSKRQFFIKEGKKALKAYPLDVQVSYYDTQKDDNKEDTLRHMSNEAMDQVWNRGELKDRENCLNSWNLVLGKYKLLFENENKGMFNILKLYCANEEKSVDAKLQRYFVEQLVGEHNQRAYEVLLVCADVNDRTLEVQTLEDLISMLGGDHGEQAHEVLLHYWEKHTLPAKVVKALIKTATESFVDDGTRRAYELLKEVVRRDGFTTELAELFFSRCSGNEDEEMTEILNERMDTMLIDWECVSERDEEDRKKLTEYFSIREDVSVEGQKKLREWQYVLYRRTNHKLDGEAISFLLVKRLKEDDLSFFMQVLDEAGDELSEKDVKLMSLTPWKRDILIERFAKEAKKEGIGTV